MTDIPTPDPFAAAFPAAPPPIVPCAADASFSEEMLRIDEALCFALYAASRAITNLYRPLLAELGLTYPQYVVMLSLWERDDVPIKTLADQLKLDHGTLSPLLKRLDAAGLIHRDRATEDERTVRITLTPAGRALAQDAQCVPPQITAATGLEESRSATLLADLKTLAETIERATVDGVTTRPPR